MKNKYSNLVTVLTSKTGQHKSWRLDENNNYVLLEKSFSKYFSFNEIAISDIHDLHALLLKNQYKRNSCFIRGKITESAYKEQLDGYQIRRLINEKVEDNIVYEKTITDSPKNWIMLDIDNFPTPKNINLHLNTDREKAVECFVSSLHESFQGVSYICQFSNGMFLDSKKVKAHLWFMLSEGYSCKVLKPWFEKNCVGVDPCVFRPAQILYTSNPKFVNTRDPLKDDRIFLKEKTNNKVILPKKEIVIEYLNYV